MLVSRGPWDAQAIQTNASLRRRPPRWLPIPISDGWLQFRRQVVAPLLKHWHLGKLLVRALRKACGVLKKNNNCLLFLIDETNTRNTMTVIIIIMNYLFIVYLIASRIPLGLQVLGS